MADITSVDLARVSGDNLEQASPDLLRAMVKTFAEVLMGAEADALCGAPYGQPSEDRVNYRNGNRDRRWDTRTGTIELAIPRLRQGSYFPEWLLERPMRRSVDRPASPVSHPTAAGGSGSTSGFTNSRSGKFVCSSTISSAASGGRWVAAQ
jgi:Transposase, Mutator family